MLALILAAVAVGAASADAAPPIEALLVREDGRVEHLDSAHRTVPEGTVWVWSADSPPISFASSEWPRVLPDLLERTRAARAGVTRFRIGGVDPELVERVALIAAPAPMWGRVPETMLPRYPFDRSGIAVVPRGAESVRVRAVGPSLGTEWEDVDPSNRTVALQARKAADLVVVIESATGETPEPIYATVLTADSPRASAVRAQAFAGRDATITVESVPLQSVLKLIVSAPGHAPAALHATSGAEPISIRLEPGIEVRGRFVDAESAPIAGVEVEAEAWISDGASALVRRKEKSDAEGRWTIASLPMREVGVRAWKRGFSTFVRSLPPPDSRIVDLGDLLLEITTPVELLVLDGARRPVEGAFVASGNRRLGRTDARGLLTIEVPASRPSEIAVDAHGFAQSTVELRPPFRERKEVRMGRAAMVTGLVLDDGGAPVADLAIRFQQGGAYRTVQPEKDGTFEIEVRPEQEMLLTFLSPSTRSLLRTEEPVRPGDIRDLGVVTLDRGWVVTGSITNEAGQPIEGAHLWMPGLAPDGPIASWLAGQRIEARSRADGTFALSGLEPGPALIRIDAPEYAREHLSLSLEEATTPAGTVALKRGGDVAVRAAQREQASARVDLRGEWLDLDMLTAPVVNGRAVVRHVPEGSYTMTVLEGVSVVCEESVDVRDGEITEANCGADVLVRGNVFLGPSLAAAGTLVWSRGETIPLSGVIQNTTSELGARRQEAWGLGRGVVVAPTGSRGEFQLRLGPGTWQVAWTSADLERTEPRSVTIPDAPEHRTDLRFGGSIVRGVVAGEDGAGVAGAHVREIGGTLFTISRADGSFGLTGLGEGAHRLQAQLGARASEPVEVVVASAQPPPPVVLTLESREENELQIAVKGPAGEPAAGAFVFLEMGGPPRTLTADQRGRVRTSFLPGQPRTAAASVLWNNRWSFARIGPCAPEDPCTAVLQPDGDGAVEITTTQSSADVRIVNSLGSDLSWMHRRLGLSLVASPEQPLRIVGLTAGTYQVHANGIMKLAAVRAGEVARIPFE